MTQLTQIGRVATTVKNIDGYTVITYHYTDVVRFNENEIVLNSNGWRTLTTKTRMNQASQQFGLGFAVYQINRKWFVSYKGDTFEFYDRITFKR